MTDDLAKYEALAEVASKGHGPYEKLLGTAITELIAMVREMCDRQLELSGELDSAERELADYKDAARSEADRVNELTAELSALKRKMREPDADLCATMIHARLHSKGSGFNSERAAWLAAVKHLLGPEHADE